MSRGLPPLDGEPGPALEPLCARALELLETFRRELRAKGWDEERIARATAPGSTYATQAQAWATGTVLGLEITRRR